MRSGTAQITVSFPESHNIVTLSVPDKPPALQLDLLHLRLKQNKLDSAGVRRELVASDKQGWELSAFMYPLGRKQNGADLREKALSGFRDAAAKSGYKLEQLRSYQRGDVYVVEYLIPDFRGQPVHQKNVFGYAVTGGMGFDFHISKISYAAADDKLLGPLLDSIKVVADYKPDNRTEFGYGSIFYLQQKWTRAISHYAKAVELEKQQRVLNSDEWTVLVDNLGMAYGLSGDLPNARATFEYGIQEDPTYPMFHYNLGCTHAEQGDVDGALEELKSAFQYKDHSNPGEGIPDPARDDSFRRYLNNPRFTKLAKELCPSSVNTPEGWTCR
jgi:tetratricopeptide (TPR) repeat protein